MTDTLRHTLLIGCLAIASLLIGPAYDHFASMVVHAAAPPTPIVFAVPALEGPALEVPLVHSTKHSVAPVHVERNARLAPALTRRGDVEEPEAVSPARLATR